MPTLTVSKSGSGAGIVTSAPAGIDCGASCSGSFVQGSAVTLMAIATAGSTFGGWTGACTNATGTCSVTMDAVKAVTANFTMLDTIAPTPGFSLQPASPAVGTLQRISFAPSTDAGGSGIDTYAISLLSCGGGCQPYELGGGNGQYSILSAQDIGFTFTPLAGGAFRFAVIVTDKAGNVGTAEFTFNISATPTATVPSAPVITTATPGERSATLAFSTPADGGSAITGYTATCGTRSTSGLFSPLTVTGLTNAVAVSCTVRADNIIGNGSASAAVSVTPQSTLVLQSAHSRKTHGAAGEFAVPINLNATIDGNVSVEPRISSGSQKVTFDFNQPIVSVGSVSIFDQNGTEIGQTFVSRANSRITVILTGVPDRTRVEIRLADVNQSRDVNVAMGFLVGDVHESRRVNSIDILTTKKRLMSPTNSVNFRADVTTAGFISPVALSAVKARSGLTLP
ncbi:MAG: hypothetical protein IPP88_03020 [Betaproteobacteria bacterium]|nr:hypothetical protein [Betaproteobacteria bacterium]